MLPVVPVQPRRLDDHSQAAGPEAVDRLRTLAEPLRGPRPLRVNGRPFGGGIAELLHTHVQLDPWTDPLGVIDASRLVRRRVPGVRLVLTTRELEDHLRPMARLS